VQLEATLPLILLAAFIGGCASTPSRTGEIVYTHRLALVWHEVRDGRIAAVCGELPRGSGHPTVTGCHYWDGSVAHIFTPVVRDQEALCTLGHEVAHHPDALGRFHYPDGTWRLLR
jgi:hypothetical protein